MLTAQTKSSKRFVKSAVQKSNGKSSTTWDPKQIREMLYHKLGDEESWNIETDRHHEYEDGNCHRRAYTVDIEALEGGEHAHSAQLYMLVNLRGCSCGEIRQTLTQTENDIEYAGREMGDKHLLEPEHIELFAYFLNASSQDFSAAARGYKTHVPLTVKLYPTNGKPRWIDTIKQVRGRIAVPADVDECIE